MRMGDAAPAMSRLEIPGYLTLTVIVFVSTFGRWLGATAVVPALLAAGVLWVALVRTGGVALRPQEALGRLWGTVAVAGGLLVGLYLVLAQWGNLWHDPWCHHAIVNGFLRGGLPLPDPGAPTQPSAYHFGFGILAAGLRHLPFVPDTESALDLASFWAGLCVAWAAIALWRRWDVSPLQMSLGLLLLFLSPGLLRWAGAGLSSIPYDSISFNHLSWTQGGTFHSLLTLLGRRGHILGILALVLAGGTSRDLLSAQAMGSLSRRQAVGFGLRFGLCLGSAALSADYALPLAAYFWS